MELFVKIVIYLSDYAKVKRQFFFRVGKFSIQFMVWDILGGGIDGGPIIKSQKKNNY